MVCFMCGLNLIEDVLTVCCLYCLCLESWDVISACLVTPLSLSAVSVMVTESRVEPGEPARRFCPLSLLSQHRLATGDCGQAELSSL